MFVKKRQIKEVLKEMSIKVFYFKISNIFIVPEVSLFFGEPILVFL